MATMKLFTLKIGPSFLIMNSFTLKVRDFGPVKTQQLKTYLLFVFLLYLGQKQHLVVIT